MGPKQIAKAYFLSAWLPSVLLLVIAGLLLLAEMQLPQLSSLLFLVLVLSFFGVVVSGIVQLIKRHWVSGAINLLALPLIGFLLLRTLGALMLSALFNDEPDNFGKDIVIPADMQLSDPIEKFVETPISDELTEKILAAFSGDNLAVGPSTISTDLTLLNEFSTANRQKLIEHFSASPRWFVTEERGKPYAYRRLAFSGSWENSLNGFYSSFNLAQDSHFQTRIIIGFDGPVFDQPFHKTQTAAKVGPGDCPLRVLEDKAANQGKESYLVLQSSKASVEIFEQSRRDSRPITQLALAEIKRELEEALLSPGPGVTPPAAELGPAELQVARGMQGGIYQVRALVNPGEAGRVYLKVFEATRNTPLSADRIQPRSIARIGWSSNPEQKFCYLSEITVYEGDWGNFYPGRFELWFIPDSKGPERKLIERIFRIEGWMR